jgi:predicted TIM-barrel enzyme
MVGRILKSECLKRLRKTIDEGKPIIGVGCGAGIVGKCAEKGGADLLIIYNSGPSRFMGLPTQLLPRWGLGYGDYYAITMGLGQETMFVVKDTPVIGGVDPTDQVRNVDKVLKDYANAGFSGVINYPDRWIEMAVVYGQTDPKAEETYLKPFGWGFDADVEMIRLANEQKLLTVAYVYTSKQAEDMAKVGCDIIVPHVGWTTGGTVGFVKSVTLEEAAKLVNKMGEPAKKIKSDIIVLCHGGPINDLNSVKYVCEHSVAVGITSGSMIERIPVEKAITDTVKQFKDVKVSKK